MSKDAVEREVGRMASEIAGRLALEVVEVVFRRQGKHTLLRVDIDRPGVPGVGLEDCERVSRELEGLLDETDLLTDRYDLQVSSPGLDRPIRTDEDIRRNTGRRIVVETTEAVDGRACFRGVLLGSREEAIVLSGEEAEREITLPLSLVAVARQDPEADLRKAGGGRKRAGSHDRTSRRGIV